MSEETYAWERITAREVEVGDLIAATRNVEPSEVTGFGPAGATARYIETGHTRIRPRYETKLWRATIIAAEDLSLALDTHETLSVEHD